MGVTVRVIVGVTVRVIVGVTVRVTVRVIVGVRVLVIVIVGVGVGVAVSETDELRFIKNSPANSSPLKRFILQIHRMNSLYGPGVYIV